MTPTSTPTPMMLQWQDCKESAPGALLLFRLGDFYEAFYEDAELLSKLLDITLTKRQEIPMAGIPHHMCDLHIDRIIAKGHRIAIAEQVEDPKEVKGIVKRKVVRIITPGTVITSSLLQEKEQSYLASIFLLKDHYGLALVDITTGEFSVTEIEGERGLLDALSLLRPKEIVLSKKWKEGKELLKELNLTLKPTWHEIESWHFDHQNALTFLCRHLQIETLDGFGLKGMVPAINAAGALLTYISEELHLPIHHIRTIKNRCSEGAMQIDKSTQRHLELLHPLHEGQRGATLLHLLDETQTAMGGRLLRKWITHPLLSPDLIKKRQDTIEKMMEELSPLLELRSHLAQVRDLERLIMRVETGFAGPRDLLALRFSLEELPHLSRLTSTPFPDLSLIAKRIKEAISDVPPIRLNDGGTIRKGYHAPLDALLKIKEESQLWMAEYQTRLRENLGIKTIKVGYTNAFGFYIEVSKGQAHLVPPQFYKRQTLVNAERFTTEELKEFEHQVLSADEQITTLEVTLFHELRHEISLFAHPIRESGEAIAHLDCLSTFAKIALERGYVRPLVDDGSTFEIEAGRHPVIEADPKVHFVANDLFLDREKVQLALITGPNMGGKSTFIRQAALIAILAQIGSFVPAKRVHIGIIDKLFSRIGSGDDLLRGHSTFMVEMAETASILRGATDRSLIILDEVGRGTSTYDGMAIAWAVAEYLLTTAGKQAKTLFATHYLELTKLAKQFGRAKNLQVAVQESDERILFLHQISSGMASKSYGIHVAKLAGLPREALSIAITQLDKLEKGGGKPPKRPPDPDLFSLITPPKEPILEELKKIDPSQITPLDALQLLFKWKQRYG